MLMANAAALLVIASIALAAPLSSSAQQASTTLQPAASTASTEPSRSPGMPPLMAHAPPDYPRAELAAGVGGRVVLLVTVDKQGMPVDVKVETSSRNRNLDKAAIEAAKGWQFNPLIRDGVAVDGDVVRVPVEFDPHAGVRH